MARRVLVTRPDPEATRTARRLKMLGFEPVVLPLSETRSLPVTRDAVHAYATAVAVTSSNALCHAPSELVERLIHLTCHAVGAKTADNARRFGFGPVNEGSGDATGLADRIAVELGKETLVYLCGRVRMPEFERQLGTNGIKVVPIETYDTVALEPEPSLVQHRLDSQPVDAVLVYSARAAVAYGKLLATHAEAAMLIRRAHCLCLSGRIAAAMGGGLNIEVALDPNEDALLALLSDQD